MAHVLEMQGRRAEGVQWIAALAPGWEGTNNLQHHLWWHAALFRLEQGDTSGALDLYDTRFRNASSPLTVASPDVYIDVQNAAAMLFRLERLGVDVGDRWVGSEGRSRRRCRARARTLHRPSLPPAVALDRLAIGGGAVVGSPRVSDAAEGMRVSSEGITYLGTFAGVRMPSSSILGRRARSCSTASRIARR